MKRILAAALSLALLGSLAACGGKDRFDAGKVEEGVCYQLTGIAPDAVAMKVDGIDVPMDMYFYNLCYAASYMESYMNMYGMDLDWSMELQEGETVLDVTKDSILENTKSFAVIEKLAQENNVILDEAALSELEAERAETVESLGGEESYRAELAKLGLSEETYDRMCRSDYLYSALEELAVIVFGGELGISGGIDSGIDIGIRHISFLSLSFGVYILTLRPSILAFCSCLRSFMNSSRLISE